jgi:hypothetical protein
MESKFSIPSQPDSSTLVFEYGLRVDKECQEALWGQIRQARELYNNIVAAIRRMFDEMHTFVMDHADEKAHALQEEIEAGIEQFKIYKAEQDEEGMKITAQMLREMRSTLFTMLKEVRTKYKKDIQERFFSRVGISTSNETYRIRSQAVKDGLGFATATAVLNRAIVAYKTRLKYGKPPEFARGADKQSDSLIIQFTLAGGCPVKTLLDGGHSGLELRATNGFGKRKYGEFRFLLGAASAKTYAHGTIQLHRPLPEGAHVATAALVRKRIGKDFRFFLQLALKLPQQDIPEMKSDQFATVHFGWASTEAGRHVMSIANQADPGAAKLIVLPESIERDIAHAEEISSARDKALNDTYQALKTSYADMCGASKKEAVTEALATINRLQQKHYSPTRLYWLCNVFKKNDETVPAWLEAWRKNDRLFHQAISHTKRRALNRRRTFYRQIAYNIANSYKSVVIERINLKEAGTKVDSKTGEISEMNRKSRYGQRLVAITELISAIHNAAGKTGCVILELLGEKTVQRCAFCTTEGVSASESDAQILSCSNCGAEIGRKQNGAAVAWQLAEPIIDNLIAEAKARMSLEAEERSSATLLKKTKMAAARAANRALREQQVTDKTQGGSHP